MHDSRHAATGPPAAVVSTYVPRHCGLATFARDLVSFYGGAHASRPVVVAVSNEQGEFDYPPEVVYEIRVAVGHDYDLAADFLNSSPIDIVILQHEYGIFGGEDGRFILRLAENLRKPLVSVLHTVLPNPTEGQMEVLWELCDKSAAVVVLAQSAIPILKSVYGVARTRITHIPHGAPDLPFSDPVFYKETLGLTGKTVALTFGHLGPSKGIEVALRALAQIATEFPDLVYLIVGATHPEVLKRFGETYRESLERLVEELDLTQNVRFVNKYLSETELEEYIQAADIYISPYPGADQVSSGPLAFAIAAGKAVISTPYVAARELLSDGKGVLTPFNDPTALAESLRSVINDGAKTVKMRKAAYRLGRTFTWKTVGTAYRKLCAEIMAGRRLTPRPDFPIPGSQGKLNWDYLLTLIDDTGVLQHCKYNVPERNHGYCTDDNARAIVLACEDWRLREDPSAIEIIRRCLAFIEHAYNAQAGRIRNFMAYDRHWSERIGSEDSHARAVWATGVAAAFAPPSAGQRCAFELFHTLCAPLQLFTSPRAWAIAVLGISSYLVRYGGDVAIRKMGLSLAGRLAALYTRVRTAEWRWFEDVVCYDNARLPEALLAACEWDPSGHLKEYGLESLEWLFKVCTDETNGHLSLIGNRGWWTRGKQRARWDQQPIDAAAMVAAAKQAHIVTADPIWLERMETAYEWFLGRNDVGMSLADESGGCRDGLSPTGVNYNMGAESTLSWMLAQMDMATVWMEDERVFITLRQEAERFKGAAAG